MTETLRGYPTIKEETKPRSTVADKLYWPADKFVEHRWCPILIVAPMIGIAFICSLKPDNTLATVGKYASTLIGSGAGGLALGNSAREFIKGEGYKHTIKTAKENIRETGGISEGELEKVLYGGKIPDRGEIRTWAAGKVEKSESRSYIVNMLAKRRRVPGDLNGEENALTKAKTIRAGVVLRANNIITRTREKKANEEDRGRRAVYTACALAGIAIMLKLGAIKDPTVALWGLADDGLMIGLLGGSLALKWANKNVLRHIIGLLESPVKVNSNKPIAIDIPPELSTVIKTENHTVRRVTSRALSKL